MQEMQCKRHIKGMHPALLAQMPNLRSALKAAAPLSVHSWPERRIEGLHPTYLCGGLARDSPA